MNHRTSVSLICIQLRLVMVVGFLIGRMVAEFPEYSEWSTLTTLFLFMVSADFLISAWLLWRENDTKNVNPLGVKMTLESLLYVPFFLSLFGAVPESIACIGFLTFPIVGLGILSSQSIIALQKKNSNLTNDLITDKDTELGGDLTTN